MFFWYTTLKTITNKYQTIYNQGCCAFNKQSMKSADRHFKFINSKSGYVISHYTVKRQLSDAELKLELEKVKANVATLNGIFLNTIYWEEEKD